jgi:hypothetical protein
MRWLGALASIVLLAAAAAVAAPSHPRATACAATMVRYGPAKHPTLGDQPWVLARPQTNAVIGFLPGYARTLRDQRVNDADGLVLWQTGERIVWTLPSGTATLVARRLDGPGSVRFALRKTSDGLVSTPRFPTAGCWRLTLGGASVVASVVDRPTHLGCDATVAPTTELTLVRPRSAGIAGGFSWRTDDGRLLIYTHGIGPGDLSAKVLWASKRGHGSLSLTGIRLDGKGRFRQDFNEAGTSQYSDGYHAVFPSIVDIPAPGCWLLRLRLERYAGALVVVARNR